jgi:hypothetical protein
MVKGRKRGGNGAAAEVPAPERVAELRSRLAELTADDLDDAELEALVESVAREEPEEALAAAAHLAGLTAGSKARAKALRRGLHRLRQRGLDVSALEEESPRAGVRLTPEHGPGGGLVVLLAPPDINAQRQLTFGVARGAGVIIVEALFRTRELFRLMARPTTRPGYRRFAQGLIETTGRHGLPERVPVPPEWLARKLWELGRYARRGELGREVDRVLLDFLVKGQPDAAEPPPHPALALPLEDAAIVPVARLVEQPHRLYAFYHGSALGALRQDYYERGGQVGAVTPGEAEMRELREAMRGPVGDWAKQWGPERIVEVLLDCALFFDTLADREAAATFVSLARLRADEAPRERDERIREFLLDVALWQLTS